MNTILQKRIEEAVKKTACPQCVFNDGGTCNNDDDCKLLDDFVGLMTFALQNQWISVEEALPEEDEQIIAMSEFGDIERMKYHNKAFYHLKGSIIKDGEKITHWMENPSLKGSKDE